MTRRILIVLGLVAATGCTTSPDMAKRDPAYSPVRPVAAEPQQDANPGGLYAQGNNMGLYGDQRAAGVGDILTVQLDETTSASKSNNAATNRTNSMEMENPNILGAAPQFNAPGVLPLDSNEDNNLSLGIGSNSEFEGGGDSSQSNSLQGDITVTVVEVLANGNLVVRGEKVLSLTGGDEHIRFSGIVRPRDITAENTVPSSRVADPQITYEGTGMLADASEKGWLTRFLGSVWPF
ncbi:flagellar L-ring protein precursor FlgH [Thiohalospira halophila DSM 15071]|uniref:Flagellar L-ring protein n=1 Tax=Thiohalospira halophila DSM 15071 TaxID=1123397 RepID=A0A1I1WBT8_9GAMM|nr:flagellar basal body L-ring protein FlgH [Thiohalospira halophila]SFD92627.1 flagellar L-ring protein precursor FlgH [Thiohalospira halophila DSM 15071]